MAPTARRRGGTCHTKCTTKGRRRWVRVRQELVYRLEAQDSGVLGAPVALSTVASETEHGACAMLKYRQVREAGARWPSRPIGMASTWGQGGRLSRTEPCRSQSGMCALPVPCLRPCRVPSCLRTGTPASHAAALPAAAVVRHAPPPVPYLAARPLRRCLRGRGRAAAWGWRRAEAARGRRPWPAPAVVCRV